MATKAVIVISGGTVETSESLIATVTKAADRLNNSTVKRPKITITPFN